MIALSRRLAAMLAILSLASVATALPAGEHSHRDPVASLEPSDSTMSLRDASSNAQAFIASRELSGSKEDLHSGSHPGEADSPKTKAKPKVKVAPVLPLPATHQEESKGTAHHGPGKHVPGQHHRDHHNSKGEEHGKGKHDHAEDKRALEQHQPQATDADADADPSADGVQDLDQADDWNTGSPPLLSKRRHDDIIFLDGGWRHRYFPDVILGDDDHGHYHIHVGRDTEVSHGQSQRRDHHDHHHDHDHLHIHDHDEPNHVHIHEHEHKRHNHDHVHVHHHDFDHYDEHKHVHIHDRRDPTARHHHHHDHYDYDRDRDMDIDRRTPPHHHHGDRDEDRHRSQDVDIDKDRRRSPSSTYSHENKRDTAASNGIPGTVDLVGSSPDGMTRTKFASMLLSPSADSSSTAPFVLNASNTNSTTVYLIQDPDFTPAADGNSATQEKDVWLGFPIYDPTRLSMESYCATFDPNPDQPSPMMVDTCMPGLQDAHKSQRFAYNPSSGVLRPVYFSNSNATAASSNSTAAPSKRDATNSTAPQNVTLVFTPQDQTVPAQQLQTTFLPTGGAAASNSSSAANNPAAAMTSVAPTAAALTSSATSPMSTTDSSAAMPTDAVSDTDNGSSATFTDPTDSSPTSTVSAAAAASSTAAPPSPTGVADSELMYAVPQAPNHLH